MATNNSSPHVISMEADDDEDEACCPAGILPYIALFVHYLPRIFIGVGVALLITGVIMTLVINLVQEHQLRTCSGPVLLSVGGGLVILGLAWLYWRYLSARSYESRELRIPKYNPNQEYLQKAKPQQVYCVNKAQPPQPPSVQKTSSQTARQNAASSKEPSSTASSRMATQMSDSDLSCQENRTSTTTTSSQCTQQSDGAMSNPGFEASDSDTEAQHHHNASQQHHTAPSGYCRQATEGYVSSSFTSDPQDPEGVI